MFWFGILKPTGRAMPSMVFNADRNPIGLAFFSSKDNMDKYLSAQTQLEYEPHELDKTLKAEDFIELVISHFAVIFGDAEKAAAIAMEGTPVFIDPPHLVMSEEDPPTYQNLYGFLADKIPGIGNRNFKNLTMERYKGYTILVNELLIDHTFMALIRKGTFNTIAEFADLKADDKSQYMTGYLPNALDAELGAKAIIDELVELGKEEG